MVDLNQPLRFTSQQYLKRLLKHRNDAAGLLTSILRYAWIIAGAFLTWPFVPVSSGYDKDRVHWSSVGHVRECRWDGS